MTGPALGIIELTSIARGVLVADAMVKKAPVRILQSHPISPGKHIIVIAGEVAEVDESMQAGLAVAVFETFSVASTVLAADAAAKAAEVTLLDMRLGQGLGGKGFFTMTGDLESIQAAADAGRAAIENGLLVGIEIIARPHEDLSRKLMW